MDLSEDFELPETYGEVRVRRMPSSGIAAVLAVLLPGLGHVYAGRQMRSSFLDSTTRYKIRHNFCH